MDTDVHPTHTEAGVACPRSAAQTELCLLKPRSKRQPLVRERHPRPVPSNSPCTRHMPSFTWAKAPAGPGEVAANNHSGAHTTESSQPHTHRPHPRHIHSSAEDPARGTVRLRAQLRGAGKIEPRHRWLSDLHYTTPFTQHNPLLSPSHNTTPFTHLPPVSYVVLSSALARARLSPHTKYWV